MVQLTEEQKEVYFQMLGMIVFVAKWTDGDPATGDMIRWQVDRFFGGKSE